MSFRSNVRSQISWRGDPWSKSFAYAAYAELFDSQSFVPIFTGIVGNASWCWLAPIIDQHAVTLYSFYGLKRRLIDPSMLIYPNVDEMIANWQDFSRAHVVAKFDEASHVPFSCIGHAATTRAARELNVTSRLGLPHFHEFTTAGSRYLARYREDRGISIADSRVDVAAMHEHQLYMRS